MTIALASIKEGSEESRQKRAVRRYLNKKKGKPVEEAIVFEGSEEERQRRAKRIEQKKKGKKEPIEESVISGSTSHMEHSVDQYHHHRIEHPDYHIHQIGFWHATNENPTSKKEYLVVHKHPLRGHGESGSFHPVHKFSVSSNVVKHEGRVV